MKKNSNTSANVIANSKSNGSMAMFSRFKSIATEAKTTYTSNSSFEVVEGSVYKFSSAELAVITKAVIRECGSQYKKKDGSERTSLKLCITYKVGNKKLMNLWFKLDSKSYKRYSEKKNFLVDASMVAVYMVHDTEEKYGKEENNYSWWEVRIKEGALKGADDSRSFLDEILREGMAF